MEQDRQEVRLLREMIRQLILTDAEVRESLAPVIRGCIKDFQDQRHPSRMNLALYGDRLGEELGHGLGPDPVKDLEAIKARGEDFRSLAPEILKEMGLHIPEGS